MADGVGAGAALLLSIWSTSEPTCSCLRVSARRPLTTGPICMRLRLLAGPMPLALLERCTVQVDRGG